MTELDAVKAQLAEALKRLDNLERQFAIVASQTAAAARKR